VLADEKSTAKTIGDEAFQIQTGFPDVTVAVCPDRLAGIREIRDRRPKTEVVILDDSYQHRRLRIGLNILLIDNNRLTYRDFMLPFGELRESAKNTDRADIIIITKCPDTMLPVDCLSIRKRIDPFPYQKIYFTRYAYSAPLNLFSGKTTTLEGKNVLAVTGIACPEPLHEYIRKNSAGLEKIVFNDHHSFSSQDIPLIAKRLEAMPEDSIVLVTDKDRAKLSRMDMPESLKKSIYSISVGVEFMFNGEDDFKKQIFKYMKREKV
jgi:tetraacyldisaccharide 4'-kinase